VRSELRKTRSVSLCFHERLEVNGCISFHAEGIDRVQPHRRVRVFGGLQERIGGNVGREIPQSARGKHSLRDIFMLERD
jgi:hypothetical protein